jgi:hypothetical protein
MQTFTDKPQHTRLQFKQLTPIGEYETILSDLKGLLHLHRKYESHHDHSLQMS